jgi:hypothetical protein
MSQSNYKVTITEHDYNYTTWVAWVQASSKNQAMVKAGALAGQEKARREAERTGRAGFVEGLMDPEVRMEPAPLDEYWEHREEVELLDSSQATA